MNSPDPIGSQGHFLIHKKMDSRSSIDTYKSDTTLESTSTGLTIESTSTIGCVVKKKLPRRILERHLEILQYESLTEEQQEEYLEYWDKKFKEDLAANPPPPFVPDPRNARKHAMCEVSTFDIVTESLYKRAYFPKCRRPRRI